MKRSFCRDRARITEIFSSIQGEGPRMGEKHLFVRFEACSLGCAYCDERKKRGRSMTLVSVLRAIDGLEKKYGPHLYVVLTGGEPLLEVDFLKLLCRALKKRNHKILLETNGILERELAAVRNYCDLIAMDIKLASVGEHKNFLEQHAGFLASLRSKKTYIKIVVSEKADRADYGRHLRMIRKVAPGTPVFLQPVSRYGNGLPDRRLLRFLERLQRIGTKYVPEVRIGIQLHKMLNIR